MVIKEIVGSLQEFDLMTIRNRNIIQFYHHDGRIQIMDFADGGTLAFHIEKVGDRREEIARQISDGLVYLHGMDFVHKKIRSSNILLTANFDAKIAGFGSNDIDSDGDALWMAPEVRSGKSKPTARSDIYGLGVIMREMGEGSNDYMLWMNMCLHNTPSERPFNCLIKEAPQDHTSEKEPLEQLKDMARSGIAEVANYLGMMYFGEIHENVSKDENEALVWFTLAANLGHREAQATLGHHYYNQGDDDTAEDWYSKAAQQGSREAWSSLGELLRNKCRYVDAWRNYHLAASAGDAHSQYWLGEMCYRGYTLQDDMQAFEWFFKAAAQGYSDAEYSVGYMYQHGRGVTASYEEAEKWYLLAIEKGHADAEKHLKLMQRDRVSLDRLQEVSAIRMFADGDLDPVKLGFMLKNFNESFLQPMDFARAFMEIYTSAHGDTHNRVLDDTSDDGESDADESDSDENDAVERDLMKD